MEQSKFDTILEQAKSDLQKIENNDFTFYFFVYDSKGTPKGDLSYIYETAFMLKELGYNVAMAVMDLDGKRTKSKKSKFVGVKDWMGEKYANLPHFEKEIQPTTTDFVIIPELFSNVMKESKPRYVLGKFEGIRSKRIILSQTLDYITEIIPHGDQWGTYGILDCVTTSNTQSTIIQKYFPYMKVKTIHPHTSPIFREPITPKEMTISLYVGDSSITNKIVKAFYWKYPQYSWVGFKHLNGFSRELLADELGKSTILVWDDNTDWGYVALEGMNSGNIVIGRIPENLPDWMKDDDKLCEAGLWYYTIEEMHELLSKAIEAYLTDTIPNNLYESMDKIRNTYTIDKFKNDVKDIWGGYVKEQKDEFIKLINEVELRKNFNN